MLNILDALLTLVVLLMPGGAIVWLGLYIQRGANRAYQTLTSHGTTVPAWNSCVTRLTSYVLLVHGSALTALGMFLAWCALVG